MLAGVYYDNKLEIY